MTAPVSGDASALAAALGALGFPCDVESRGALALVAMPPDDAARLAASSARSAALALARQHGFTHLAVELRAGPQPQPDGGRASLLRD